MRLTPSPVGVAWGIGAHFYGVKEQYMGTRPQPGGHPNSSDEPPLPGGDPDQPPSDLPKPSRDGKPNTKVQDPKEYGHVDVEDRPEGEARPKPHQIF